ncbi:hypothetical protein HJG60_011970 [Phyllostomus discolor]|uniref:Uncharacterized protein n=1 Tax=Phyllostomus discolor TaxID=89673 RepID=A0A833ZLH7_9CHIR|nr:hypothetical protein HJG60_011970 [Phyllostomus discolor]
MSYSDGTHLSKPTNHPGRWARVLPPLSITPSYCVSGVVNGIPGRLWHMWPVGCGDHAAGRVAVPSPSAVPGICREKSEERVEVTGGFHTQQFEPLSGPRNWPPAHSVTLAEDEWIGTAAIERLGTARFGGRVT